MVELDESLDDVMPETAAPRRPSRRFRPSLTAWRLAAGLTVGALLPLMFMRAHWLPLFMAQLGLTEYGHWLAPAFVALGAWPWRRPADRAAGALCLAVAAVLMLPAMRASVHAGRLSAETRAAWGEPADGAPTPAFSWRRLWSFWRAGGGVQRSDEVYDAERGLSLTLWQGGEGDALLTKRPVVLVLHGGGWDQGGRNDFPAFNAALARLGWVVADVDYRLAPKDPWPAQRDDVMRALEHLRLNAKRLSVDPGHVVLFGRSAGAHLALSFAYLTQDPAIRGVVALYGPSDLVYAWEHGSPHDILDSPRLLRQFTGGTPASHPAIYDEASPLRHVDAHTPPTLLMHGAIDDLVWPHHSRALAAALAKAGVPSQYVELPWATHGFDYGLNGPGGQAALHAVQRFLQAADQMKK